jgi:hypothetical protein
MLFFAVSAFSLHVRMTEQRLSSISSVVEYHSERVSV